MLLSGTEFDPTWSVLQFHFADPSSPGYLPVRMGGLQLCSCPLTCGFICAGIQLIIKLQHVSVYHFSYHVLSEMMCLCELTFSCTGS